MMNLYLSAAEYDYHTLLKVAEMAGLAGIVGFHESEDGYIVSFPDTENTQALIKDYKARLRDLETISGSTKLPLTLRRASVRFFFIVLFGRGKTYRIDSLTSQTQC